MAATEAQQSWLRFHERAELNERLAQAIEELPDRERLVITLYYFEELTLREVAAVLDISPSRVSQLNTSAILKLRASLRFGRPVAALRTR